MEQFENYMEMANVMAASSGHMLDFANSITGFCLLMRDGANCPASVLEVIRLSEEISDMARSAARDLTRLAIGEAQ